MPDAQQPELGAVDLHRHGLQHVEPADGQPVKDAGDDAGDIHGRAAGHGVDAIPGLQAPQKAACSLLCAMVIHRREVEIVAGQENQVGWVHPDAFDQTFFTRRLPLEVDIEMWSAWIGDATSRLACVSVCRVVVMRNGSTQVA